LIMAERTLPSSNLKPLNKLETSRLDKVISIHRISGLENETLADTFGRDLVAINDFLHFVEAEPYITHEKAENHKRVPFKKVKAA